MEDYDSNQFPDASDWGSRFPEDAVGYDHLKGLDFTPHGNLQAWHNLSQIHCVPAPSAVPRLFVSHRQADRAYGLRAACLAAQKGCCFWLDVLDPTLQSAAYQALPDQQKALVTAIVIEVALLNSTHVLALVTPNTHGSLWVPYEYGRVKTEAVYSKQAASWHHPQTAPGAGADYLELGAKLHSDPQVSTWIDAEVQRALGPSPPSHPCPPGSNTPLP